ncbi:hypothetical protein [Halorussus halophilus]|uniref:hypothetical protein n=1 Tax=Halorussus halophilus TaxID=2650975 RepID=UPI0013013267|nr:hypothetical protein [Halorussus halophilus]
MREFGTTEPPSSENSQRDIVLLFIAIVLSVVVTTFTGVLIFGFNPNSTLTAINTIGSLFLSAILAYLYFRMTRTQSTRNEIQNQQKKILMQQKEFLEASYKPSIIVEEWDVRKDEVEIILSNVGQGTAEEVGLVVNIERTAIDSYSFEENSPNLEARKSLEKTNPGNGIDSNVLEEDERSVKFVQNAYAEETRGKPQERIVVPFNSVCKYLQLNQPEAVTLDVWLVFEDLIGKQEEEHLWSAALRYEQENCLGELLSKGVIELNRTKNTIAPSSAPDDLHTPGPY